MSGKIDEQKFSNAVKKYMDNVKSIMQMSVQERNEPGIKKARRSIDFGVQTLVDTSFNPVNEYTDKTLRDLQNLVEANKRMREYWNEEGKIPFDDTTRGGDWSVAEGGARGRIRSQSRYVTCVGLCVATVAMVAMMSNARW